MQQLEIISDRNCTFHHQKVGKRNHKTYLYDFDLVSALEKSPTFSSRAQLSLSYLHKFEIIFDA